MAVRTNRPYFEFLRKFLKTSSFEELIDTIKSNLEKKAVKTDVFKSYWPHQFVVCMWTKRRRRKLLKRSTKYDALVVLGCEAAVDTIHDAVKTDLNDFVGSAPQFDDITLVVLVRDSQ